jgi:hypothetical protein
MARPVSEVRLEEALQLPAASGKGQESTGTLVPVVSGEELRALAYACAPEASEIRNVRVDSRTFYSLVSELTLRRERDAQAQGKK